MLHRERILWVGFGWLLALSAGAVDLDGVGRGVGGLGSPGVDDPRIQDMIRKAEEAAQRAEEAARRADEAQQLVEEAAQGLQQNQFIVRGYNWMAESCSRIRDAQALLNCEGANLYYLQYQEAFNSEEKENKARSQGLYARHKKSADKAIRFYKKAN